jgi:hypothetical protein
MNAVSKFRDYVRLLPKSPLTESVMKAIRAMNEVAGAPKEFGDNYFLDYDDKGNLSEISEDAFVDKVYGDKKKRIADLDEDSNALDEIASNGTKEDIEAAIMKLGEDFFTYPRAQKLMKNTNADIASVWEFIERELGEKALYRVFDKIAGEPNPTQEPNVSYVSDRELEGFPYDQDYADMGDLEEDFE